MAGHVITTYLEETGAYEVVNIVRKQKWNQQSSIIDVTDFTTFDTYLNAQYIDIVINCIGVLNQFATTYKDKAILLNSYLPHFLANKYEQTATKIIHLSTDCVFSGKGGSYTETSFRDGDTFYDRTKAIGELWDDRHLTFRTSIIGPDINPQGIGLFNWFMQAEGTIQGYVNAIWTGITTIELAKAIEQAIIADLSGLYHLVPDQTICKHELLLLFKDIFQRTSIDIIPLQNPLIDKSLINTRNDFNHQVPDYKTMLYEMKEWIVAHATFYSHYQL